MTMTMTSSARDLAGKYHTLARQPEQMAIDTIEEILLDDGYTPAEIAAGFVFVLREGRMVHPNGKFDRGGRWYPDPEETCDCCHGIRSPSGRWPYSLMVHCRTIKHVSNLFQVKPSRTRQTANLIAASDTTSSFRRYAWVD